MLCCMVLVLARRFLSPWWWRLYVPLKLWFLQEPHGILQNQATFYFWCFSPVTDTEVLLFTTSVWHFPTSQKVKKGALQAWLKDCIPQKFEAGIEQRLNINTTFSLLIISLSKTNKQFVAYEMLLPSCSYVGSCFLITEVTVFGRICDIGWQRNNLAKLYSEVQVHILVRYCLH
jgi:hypothetical protein